MSRRLDDWVGAFEHLTEYSGTPERLRRWAAISCIAGALERKVWVRTSRGRFFPGLYVILITDPGVGKSVILNEVRKLWANLEDHRISAPNVSRASLIDELNDAHRVLIHPGSNPPTTEFHSLKALVSELGVFLPEYANDFMNTLTDIYDGFPFSERKRTRGTEIDIPHPQINLLAGTTPSYLNNLLPEGAWDQGFLSRTLLVYSGEQRLVSLFATVEGNDALGKSVQADLNQIANLYGEIMFTEEARDFIDSWHLGGQEPKPTHPKLQHYQTRRTGHLLKLSQVACVNESNDKIITVDHIQQAMDWLFDLEAAVPEIFKAMTSGGDSQAMDECWHMLFQFKARYGKGAPKALLIEFLSRRVPSHNVERLIDLMEKANLIRAVAEKGVGVVYYAKERSALE